MISPSRRPSLARVSTPRTIAAGLLLALTPGHAQEDPFGPIPAALPLSLTWNPSQIEIQSERPDEHGPTGVLGEHPVPAGVWQFSYRYIREDFGGLQDGKRPLTKQDAFDLGYLRTPISQTRETHLISALYGSTDRLSILITIPWVSNVMNFEESDGDAFDQRTIGLSDLKVTGLYRLTEKEGGGGLHANMGVSLPTGSHDERGELPGSGGNNVKLPYPMQLGSGTLDFSPGLTWVHLDEGMSWGAQLTQVVRFQENSDDYRLGSETHATTWVARQFKDDLSGSLRIAWEHVDDYSGEDPELPVYVGSSQDPHAQGGDRLHLFLGMNYTQPGGHRFSGEIGGPVFQDLNGPQLETDIIYRLGWQFSF
ncbi:MAG: hypothetical protein O2816_09015 [Planctomycetota bacterium]|nr:hypothetical protein [Planctomycetota bacterium]